MDFVLNWFWAHTLMKFRRKIEMVHEIDLVSSELSLYTFKRVCRTTSKRLGETSKFTWNEVENWYHLTVFFSSEYYYICLFLKSQKWKIKLTESTNNFCTSDRAVRTIKVNLKERFIGNDGFLQIFMWWIKCSQRIKVLLLDKFRI